MPGMKLEWPACGNVGSVHTSRSVWSSSSLRGRRPGERAVYAASTGTRRRSFSSVCGRSWRWRPQRRAGRCSRAKSRWTRAISAARRKGRRGRGAAGKIPVFGILKRGGKVYTQMVPNVRRRTLEPILEAKVAADSVVYTDGLSSYDALDVSRFRHYRIKPFQAFLGRAAAHQRDREFLESSEAFSAAIQRLEKGALRVVFERMRVAIQLQRTERTKETIKSMG